eukprot:scaffold17398_cov155-Skeletonema_marinoi.AAC.7
MGKKKEVDTWSVPARTVCCLQFLADTWSVLVVPNAGEDDANNRLDVASVIDMGLLVAYIFVASYCNEDDAWTRDDVALRGVRLE